MKRLLPLVFILSLPAFSGDIKNGEKLWKKINCAQCHGNDGAGKAKQNKDGSWKLGAVKGPGLVGLNEEYIVAQLLAVHSKERKTKYTTSMYTKIKKYTESDFKDLAAYIAQDLGKGAAPLKGMLEK